MSIKTCLFELRQLWILLPPSWFCSLCWLSHWRSHLQLLLYTGKTLLLTCPYPFEMGDIRIFFQDWECQEGWSSMLQKRETAGSRPEKPDQPVWEPKGCDGNGISEVEARPRLGGQAPRAEGHRAGRDHGGEGEEGPRHPDRGSSEEIHEIQREGQCESGGQSKRYWNVEEEMLSPMKVLSVQGNKTFQKEKLLPCFFSSMPVLLKSPFPSLLFTFNLLRLVSISPTLSSARVSAVHHLLFHPMILQEKMIICVSQS